MHLRKDKCAFLLPQVEYLGHQISQIGLHPTKEKVRAIVEAPAPQNVSQLKSCPGNVKLLQQIFTQFVFSFSSTLQSSTQEHNLAVGNATTNCFQRSKETVNLVSGTCTF